MVASSSRSITFVHNTDLNPPGEYIATLPRIAPALRFDGLLKVFGQYDAIANTAQRRLHATGIASLALGSLALTGITVKLLLLALGAAMPPVLVFAVEISAVVSIALAVGPWVSRSRGRWLTARYVTESIRQWHFQLLLDGGLMTLASAGTGRFEEERTRRWNQFTASIEAAEGRMSSFVEGESTNRSFQSALAADSQIAEETCTAYRDLRFDRQLAYFRVKREHFAEYDEWSEAVAKWTLLTAVLMSAVQAGLALFEMTGGDVSHGLGAAVAAMAIWLVIVNATVRVYRNAMRLSEQRERYDGRWLQMVMLKNVFDQALGSEERVRAMRAVEDLSVDELREFLRQMRRASFLL